MPVTRLTIVLSSTFLDLKGYRKAAIDACKQSGLVPLAMEEMPPDPQDALRASLAMVEKADLYLGILAYRYGTVPEGKTVSITEAEYDHAIAKGIPPYFYIIDGGYRWPPDQVDKGAGAERLSALKARIARLHTARPFRALRSFKEDLLVFLPSVAASRTAAKAPESTVPGSSPRRRSQPSPPAMYSVPPYILGNRFVGRRKELAELDSWARSSDPVMVFEAIGGVGKSALTWQWANDGAPKAIAGLAGVFWFTFYEQGATLGKMCREALAYVRDRDPEDFRKTPRDELAADLLAELRRRPFLLILDGLERALVAYHRLEPDKLRDEQVDSDRRATISPRDGELLRQLVSISPSKVLISTRLMPRALQNRAHQPIPGVRHRLLAGLDPGDAVQLLRYLEVRGRAANIKDFLDQFEYHSLLITVLAGRIRDYPPAPGNFDRWLADPAAGGSLRLTDLKQDERRNHILAYALDGLEPERRLLLSRLAVFGDAVSYETAAVLNPYLPAQSDEAPEAPPAPVDEAASLQKFRDALLDLEARGLVSWDRNAAGGLFDLHPVVRGFAFDLLGSGERTSTYDRIRDHFERLPRENAEEAVELSDLANTLQIYRALVGAGQLDRAYSLLRGPVSSALQFRIESYPTIVQLLRPLFPSGIELPPELSDPVDRSYAINDLSIALNAMGRERESLRLAEQALALDLDNEVGRDLLVGLLNYACTLSGLGQTSRSLRTSGLALKLADAIGPRSAATLAHLVMMRFCADFGLWERAAAEDAAFCALPTPPRHMYRPGDLERQRCRMAAGQGTLTAEVVREALLVAERGRDPYNTRHFTTLGAQLSIEESRPLDALEPLERSLALAARSGAPPVWEQSLMARALAVLGRRAEAESCLEEVFAIENAELLRLRRGHLGHAYLALAEADRARELALDAYRDAWADGPPYAFWRELQQAKALLVRLGVAEPELPPFDPAKVEPIPHEPEILALIERFEKAAAAASETTIE